MSTSTPPSKVIGIQFGLLSPDDIRRTSVVEIKRRETYVNNKPVLEGLFDPRMGVLEPGMICPTDGLGYMQTPGYFGHIELARPVFYNQYLTTIQKCLRCVCFKCSKLLVDKNKYKEALKLSSVDRWEYVQKLAQKISRCGADIDDGCGVLQPTKITKEGLSTLFAEWKNVDDGVKLTPEMVQRIFKRISDEDVQFMGFNPQWSRPEWMICEVMLVPPPAVRPSVKQDAQQRSEDDLTHILVNIVKFNKTLQEKIQANAPAKLIDDFTTLLQYYVGTLVDNKMPGAAPAAQRSGRPFKAIKDRLNGKGGRMRGNLMAKRVDFSARSVITADPNISIRELGIPMKIAKNITKPVRVNPRNRAFLTQLVRAGPDVYPGAKILERNGGKDSITLRYMDRESIILEDGDVVHRHMMNGDIILFNRQPTLHRMSMMGHVARIMTQGDTFRMNVADTKPYNADFDGDEMNLHMSQDVRGDVELSGLAAVPHQLISPANNKSIIGIYQDSMLGSYRFTRDGIALTPNDAMNLLMCCNNVDVALFRRDKINSFDVLSQIMPPLTMQYKTKAYKDAENFKTSNHVVEIKNGHYKRGQLDKSSFDGYVRGLIQRICNDFGNMASANFIDDLQNIITEYMKGSSFSVGISDLMSDAATNQKIVQRITDKKSQVKTLLDQVYLGVFENETGRTNEQEFEQQVNNILNQASSEAGKIGLESLSKDNRFVIMVNAGSKGSELNISQMISCLGQQNVDGKRIPYGFEHRTLPHFCKFDDSPGARGFVESSYINGLSPQELFFHAMGGRVGLIDTAVKSVIYETEVVLVENGEAKHIMIGEWIDSQLDLDQLKPRVQHFEARNMELLELEEGTVYIPTTDSKGRVTWGAITAITRHDPGDTLYEITTRGGRTVTVTESKSLIVWDESTKEFLEKPTPDVVVGDFVPSTQRLGAPPCKVGIELEQWIASQNIAKDDAQYATEDVILDEIVSIRPFPAGEAKWPKVYDLTVPSTLNFGLANGLQVRDTSSTGYIQRRFIKGLEDLMVSYDMTIRTTKNKIVQFSYGDDNIDTVRVENQPIPLVNMSVQDIYAHINTPNESMFMAVLDKATATRARKTHTEFTTRCFDLSNQLITWRDDIVKHVFKGKGDSIVSCPVSFASLVQNVQGQLGLGAHSLVDITPMEAYALIDAAYDSLARSIYAPPTRLFKAMFYFNLSVKDLLLVRRFNRAALTLLLETISVVYKRAIVAPGEMVGLVAGQSMGECSTQMTLNTFHHAGISSKSNVTRGVPRIEEIINLTENPKNPSLTIHLKPDDETSKDKAHATMYQIEYTNLRDLVQTSEICFDPDDLNTLIAADAKTMTQFRAFESLMDECSGQSSGQSSGKSKWLLRFELDAARMLEKNITMDDVHFTLKNGYKDEISCVFADYNEDRLVFRIRMNQVVSAKKKKVAGVGVSAPLDQTDQIFQLKQFQDQLLNGVVLRGVAGISKVSLRKIKDHVVEVGGAFQKQDIWCLDTVGTNLLDVLGLDYVDTTRVYSNNIKEVCDVLGIEAARQTIYNELAEVIEFDGTYINYHHFSILCDRMTSTSELISIYRHGINNDDIGPIAKASFEETPEMFLRAARHGELDMVKGISANIMLGQEGFYGTSAFQLVLDAQALQELKADARGAFSVESEIAAQFQLENQDDKCSTANLVIQTNAINIKAVDTGAVSADYDAGF